jgi:hypothetical protein
MTTSTPTSTRKLTINDIADVRAYERERAEFRARVIELKRRRRLALGSLITVAFENRDTMRLQIQEVLRVEKGSTDEAVVEELKAFNPMIPEPGQLCATLFVELTSDAQVREWLPKLAGLENSISIRLADGSRVVGEIDAQHAQGLTRTDVTAAVHYLTFNFTPAQIETFSEGGAVLECGLTTYQESIAFSADQVTELLTDLYV